MFEDFKEVMTQQFEKIDLGLILIFLELKSNKQMMVSSSHKKSMS